MRKGLFAAFLVAWLASVAVVWLDSRTLAGGLWAEAIQLCLAGLIVLRALARQLPWQNVAMVGLILAAVSVGFFAVGSPIGLILVSPVYLGAGMVAVLNAYLVAQLLLRPRRRRARYGWWLMGASSLLAAVFQLAWGPFATELNLYGAAARSTFMGALLPSVAAWIWVALISLFLATPWLIDKRGSEPPPDYQPLLVWLLLNLWPIVGNLVHQLWTPAVLNLLFNAAFTAATIRQKASEKHRRI